MMAVNHLGVVIRLAEACVLRPAHQGKEQNCDLMGRGVLVL